MPFLRRAAGAYLLNRFLRGGRRSRSPYGGRYGGYGRRRRSGWGMAGPFPTYSRRTRGGSRVTVSGCCLPIPLALTVGGAFGATRFVRSR